MAQDERDEKGSLKASQKEGHLVKPVFDLLPPNDPDGHHQRFRELIGEKTIEIGNGRFQDFITECNVTDCELRIACGASSVNLHRSTILRCSFRAQREMKSMRFTDMSFHNCTFYGRYRGCRFGRELPDEVANVRNCDFSSVKQFDLCDFLEGVEIESMLWPPWPHIVVTELARWRDQWLRLDLPPELKIVQSIIGEEPYPQAVTLYLPSRTTQIEEMRKLFAAQPYIIIAQPSTSDSR